MREPFETLLGGLRASAVVSPHLSGETPAFHRIYAEEDGIYDMLSGGEQILVDIALALHNGNREARVADLFHLDTENLMRVHAALGAHIAQLRGREWIVEQRRGQEGEQDE